MFKAAQADKAPEELQLNDEAARVAALQRFKVAKEEMFPVALSFFKSKAQEIKSDAQSLLASFKQHYGDSLDACGPLLKASVEGQLVLCLVL